MSAKIVTLDVREDIRGGRDPFARIMQAVAGLKGNERLRVIAPFKPVPLLGVMASQGFSHEAHPVNETDWEVLFSRGGETAPSPRAPARCACSATPTVEVDARRLEPPQPMIKILEAVETLPEGAELLARTDRRPIHLYPHLEERGFTAETKEQSDGSCLTHIRRR
jgi:uncharacterized protein (DUF2249 family)